MRKSDPLITMEPAALGVDAFCAAHGIGRAFFYKLQAEGRGPKIFKAGKRTLISRESAADWRRRMEAETEQAAQAAGA